MIPDNYTIKELSDLNKYKEIGFIEMKIPSSINDDGSTYRFEPLEEYKEISTGALAHSEMLRGKVAEAKVAADIAKKIHSENVTANMLGELPDSKLDQSRIKAETLLKIYEEKEYACQEAITAYYLKLDRATVVSKFKEEAVPYLKNRMTAKEVEMCKARDAYLESIKDFFFESQKIEQTYNDVEQLRKDANYARGSNSLITPMSSIAFAERSLIKRPTSWSFPFQLSSDELTLINRQTPRLV